MVTGAYLPPHCAASAASQLSNSVRPDGVMSTEASLGVSDGSDGSTVVATPAPHDHEQRGSAEHVGRYEGSAA